MGRGRQSKIAPAPASAPARPAHKPKLIIPIGIPGSGKSTWTKTQKAYTVSTDRIRKAIAGSLIEAHSEEKAEITNRITFSSFHSQIKSSLNNGQDTIADATNLYPQKREQLIGIARECGAEVHLVIFTDLAAAARQNLARAADQVVPEDRMEKMRSLYAETLEDISTKAGLYQSITRL